MRSPEVRRGPSMIATMTMIVVAVFVVGGLTLGSLWALGIIGPKENPQAEAPAKKKPEGTPIPLTGRAIPAYTQITREHFLNPKTGEEVITYRSEDAVKKAKILTKLSDILGRVLIHDLPANYAFRDEDLFPKGTRPGVVAGVPPGKRAFVLPADKVQGIHTLKTGDHFDLLGSTPIDLEKAMAKLKSPLPDSVLAQNSGKHAKVRVLVQKGVVVVPVMVREVPTGSAAQGKGGVLPSKPVQEVTIAVEPEEVAPLHEALAIQATLICVGRSGQKDEAKTKSVTPGSPPGPKIHTMEVIMGNKRQIYSFPTPGTGPLDATTVESGTLSPSGETDPKK